MGRALCHVRILVVLLAILFVEHGSTHSQTPADATPNKPAAVKLLEIGPVGSSKFRDGVDRFMIELRNSPGHQGYIVNYGTEQEIGKRERLIANSIAFRKYDRSRITLVRGGYLAKPQTEFWVIPPGADNPPVGRDGQGPPSN